MPMKREEYPENWEWLSREVRKRNSGRCELCYAPNGIMVARPTVEEWERPWVHTDEVDAVNVPHRKTKIVLTVHHINGNKADNTEQNLISLCQRCHLRLDLEKHMRNRQKSKQGNDLFSDVREFDNKGAPIE